MFPGFFLGGENVVVPTLHSATNGMIRNKEFLRICGGNSLKFTEVLLVQLNFLYLYSGQCYKLFDRGQGNSNPFCEGWVQHVIEFTFYYGTPMFREINAKLEMK